MAIFLLRAPALTGQRAIDDTRVAVVEADDAAGARAAAKALDTRIAPTVWDQAAVLDISTPGDFTGSLLPAETVAGSLP